jgi:hypothetical protein
MDKKRLVLEHAAMLERWPALHPKLCRNATGTQLWWELEVGAEGGNRLPIKIEYPADYPASPPEIIVRTAVPSNTPHFWHSSQRICWRYPDETKRNRNIWCPSKDTAALCVGVAQRWFYAFLVWLTTGKWPVPDALSG